MAAPSVLHQLPSLQILAAYRRFIRWLTSAHVILALGMLVLMVYLILVPLYRMLETTLTYQEKDIHYVPDAVVGDWTLFHWVRMLTGQLGEVMTYAPLQHSLTISIGATLLALIIGSAMAWMAGTSSRRARRTVTGGFMTRVSEVKKARRPRRGCSWLPRCRRGSSSRQVVSHTRGGRTCRPGVIRWIGC